MKKPDKSPVDCGDNSCLCAYPRTGMRTNGGCRCFKMPPSTERRKAEQAVQFWHQRSNYFENLVKEVQEELGGRPASDTETLVSRLREKLRKTNERQAQTHE